MKKQIFKIGDKVKFNSYALDYISIWYPNGYIAKAFKGLSNKILTIEYIYDTGCCEIYEDSEHYTWPISFFDVYDENEHFIDLNLI